MRKLYYDLMHHQKLGARWLINNLTKNGNFGTDPFAVRCSSIYSNMFDAYYAFNGVLDNIYGGWVSNSGQPLPQYLDFAFNRQRYLYGIRIYNRVSQGGIVEPNLSTGELLGSNDDITYSRIQSLFNPNPENSDLPPYFIEVYIDKPIIYQYYRISVTGKAGTQPYTGINEVQLLVL